MSKEDSIFVCFLCALIDGLVPIYVLLCTDLYGRLLGHTLNLASSWLLAPTMEKSLFTASHTAFGALFTNRHGIKPV